MEDDAGWARVGRGAAVPVAAPRTSVAVSFGSPAQDSGVTRLDLNEVFIRNPQATFLMRVNGDAMREAGLASGDIVLVDRALEPGNGHVVVAVFDNEFVCRRLIRRGTRLHLCATDPRIADIAPEGNEVQVWGVVTTVIKSLPV